MVSNYPNFTFDEEMLALDLSIDYRPFLRLLFAVESLPKTCY
jgi:hypothetical protein